MKAKQFQKGVEQLAQEGAIPVSYTHLDVYKRQVLPCVIIITLEIFLWIDGRRQIREMELRRMKAKDI